MTKASTLEPPAKKSPLTYERYLAEFLTEPVETRICEIIDGVRVYMTSPNWRHQKISFLLSKLLDAHVALQGRAQILQAPFDVMIEPVPLRVRQPDVFVIQNETLEHGGGAPDLGPLTVPPELVIEILFPSESRRILNDKIRDFCAIGVQECWVISPEGETIEVLRLTPGGAERVSIVGGGQQVRSITFDDLVLDVTDIFATA